MNIFPYILLQYVILNYYSIKEKEKEKYLNLKISKYLFEFRSLFKLFRSQAYLSLWNSILYIHIYTIYMSRISKLCSYYSKRSVLIGGIVRENRQRITNLHGETVGKRKKKKRKRRMEDCLLRRRISEI